MTIKRALLSVSDKSGLADFATKLAASGVELISTGGTAAALRNAGLSVKDVSEVTGFPEILDGRVKTLHPKIHGGLLARTSKPEHLQTIEEHGIGLIDLVVVNLYPFAQTIAKPETVLTEAVEQIDIGGPSMLRSASKSFERVTVVCDPSDYGEVLEDMEDNNGDTSEALRARLAAKVFLHTGNYDLTISQYLASQPLAEESNQTLDVDEPARLPSVWTVSIPLEQQLRYGENPHQAAAFYRDPSVTETTVARAKQLQGKHLSYNNILDTEGALEAVRDFADLAKAACVIVKHSNPCGIAVGDDPLAAYNLARETDPDSAFGGIIAFSCEVSKAAAEKIVETFNEVLIAPGYSREALEVLATKKNLRVLATGEFTEKRPMKLVRGVVGGALVMDRDLGLVKAQDLKLVTSVTPTEKDLEALLFAWRCVKWVKSNAIVYTSHAATLGIGAGQMSRVDAAKIGVTKSRGQLNGCYMASDAFFPFRDSVDAAAENGVRGIIQPGGSIRDEEVVEAANEHSMIMVFTGMRHFRH